MVESASLLAGSQGNWADAKKHNPNQGFWEDDEDDALDTRAFRGYTGGRVLNDNLAVPQQHSLYE